jgi:hypothetical protein
MVSLSQDTTAFLAGLVILAVVVLAFLRLFRNMRKQEEEQQEAAADAEATAGAGGGGRMDYRTQQQQQQQHLPAAAQQASGPPLVCTYMRADGWREGSCGVCLSELADGDAVRVLPACMHYFHADCVGEWLLAHATCPLCRAPLAATADGVDA